jgi:hypothetical protein
LVEPKNEFVFVKMRVGTTGVRPFGIDSAKIVLEESARYGPEEMPLTMLICFQILGNEWRGARYPWVSGAVL